MAVKPKVMQLGLEETILDARRRGLEVSEITRACKDVLAARGSGESITKRSIERYLQRLDKASVAPAHQPQIAQANAMVGIAFMQRVERLDELLGKWLDEAEDAQVPIVNAEGEVVEHIPDWNARTRTAREMREHLKAYADLMQRVHDASQVKAFQESVLEAIQEASPEVAQVVLEKMRGKQDVRRAALLGAGAGV